MNRRIVPSRINGFRALAKTILLGLVLAGAADWLAPLARAELRLWRGSANAFWSEPANWDPAGVPRNGDELSFDRDESNRSMINDLTDLRIQSLSFGSENYELSGNALTVTGRINFSPIDTRTYTINCPLDLSDRVIISVDNLNGGLLFESTTELNLNGPIVLHGTVVISQTECDHSPGFDTRVHITGPISGTGNLVVSLDAVGFGPDCGNGGDSYLEFKGSEPNTFRGNLTIGGGFTGPGGSARTRVFLDKPDGVAVVGDGARLVIARDGEVTFQSSEQIGDNAEVQVNSGGALQLRNFFETIGTLTLMDNNQLGDLRPPLVDTGLRVLTLNGGLTCLRSSTNFADVPTIRGVLNLTGVLPFQIEGSPVTGLDIEAQITGAGGFVKSGNGTLILRSDNTFTGRVSVEEGVVQVHSDLAFGTSSGGVDLKGGGLTLRDAAILNERLTVVDSSSSVVALGSCTWSGPITIDEQLTIVGDDLLLSGPISGNGELVLLGTEIELSGSLPNTFTGPIHANCDLLTLNKTPAGTTAFAGPLLIGQDSSTPKEVRWLSDFQIISVATPVTLGRLARMNLNGHSEMIGSLEFRGGGSVQNSGDATLTLIETVTANVATAAATISGGRLAIAAGPRNFHVEDGALEPDLSITASIEAAGGITKTGPGTLLLGAANSFTGPVFINEGVVHIQNNTSLGTTGAGTTVADGATLQIEFVGALAEPLISIQGAGRGGTLGVLNLMAATGIGVNLFMAGPSTVRVDNSFAILGGAIGGTGPLTKLGAGTLQFGGGGGAANTYTGDTIVDEGILVLSKGTGVTTIPGHLIIGGGGGLFGVSATVRHAAGFTILGGVTLNRGGLWDLNGFSESFSAAALQGRPALTLNVGSDVQTGVGTLTLPVGGDVVVNPGTFPGASSLISGNLALDPGPHRFVVQRGVSGIGVGGLELDVSAVISQTSTAADIVKEGAGNMRLGGANSFTGPATVNEGTLTAANALALGTAAGGVFVIGNASLALEGGIEAGETLTLDTTNAAALLSVAPVTNSWSGNVILQRTAGIRVVDARGGLTLFGIPGFGVQAPIISGSGGFTKFGPGALFIAGLQRGNSYTGPTTVTDGLLEAIRTRSLSSNIVVTGVNSVLRTGRAGSQFNGALTVLPRDTSVTVQDGALWTMNPTNSETLSRLMGNGRLETGTGGALTITNDVDCTFSGPLSGGGALNKRGPAMLRLTADSGLFSGPATVSEGTYKVDGRIPNSPITVKSSATLHGGFAGSDVTVESGGLVEPDPVFPGQIGGTLFMTSANFQAGAALGATFFGPDPTGGNDHLEVANAVTLGNTSLNAEFAYAPREGDIITLINKSGAGAIDGTFNGLPEGSLQIIDEIPVVMSYVGGNGNEATLTVTNLPLRSGGAQVVSGAGGGVLVPNDCSQLWLVVTNRGASGITGLRGRLRSLTEGLVVTIADSAFPNLAPNARGSNTTPFQIRTEPSFACGAGAQLELLLTGSNIPPVAVVYTFPGNAGTALDFNGSGNYVAVPHTTSLNPYPFTLTFWVKTLQSVGVAGLVNKYTGSSLNGWNISLRNGHPRAWYYRNSASFVAIVQPTRGTNGLDGGYVADDQWHHVAFTVDASGGKIYRDGELQDSQAWTGAPIRTTTTQEIRLGNDAGNGVAFNGTLDEVSLWRTALSQAQIQTNMFRGLTGLEADLVAYYRCDEGGGVTVADSAPDIGGENHGAWVGAPLFAFSSVGPFSLPGGGDCNSGRGACESCVVVSGQFTTDAPHSARRLVPAAAPSSCEPPKPCPGVEEFPAAPVRHVLHHFTNSTAAELCVTAQLRPDCPNSIAGGFGVSAYAGEFLSDQPCSNYLGDDGAFGAVPPPFSFRVPPLTNFLLVVTARTPEPTCDSYTLELFGLPCPPPRLDIAHDAATEKVRVSWSTAYPDYRLQSVNSLDGPTPHSFGNISTPPVLVGGKFAVTNAVSTPRQFFRLAK
jgi:autotransporter-associated beta strand protein